MLGVGGSSHQSTKSNHSLRNISNMKDESMTRKQKTVFWIVMIVIQIFQMAGVILISFLNHKIFEAISIYIGMVAGKICFRKSWHADSLIICTITTWAVFYFLTSGTLPTNISIFCSLILGFILSYVLYVLAVWKEKVNTTITVNSDGGKVSADLKFLTVQEITEICQSKSFSKTDTDFLVDFIKNPDGLKKYEIADKYNYDEKYIYKKAKRLIKIIREDS